MMKYLQCIVPAFLVLIFLFGCDNNKVTKENNFENLTEDETITKEINIEIEGVENIDFQLFKASLKSADDSDTKESTIFEEQEPFMTSKDVDSYEWDGKVLKVNIEKINEKLGEKYLRQGFVLKINGKKAYYGEFWSMLSSAIPDKRIKSYFLDQIKIEQEKVFVELYNVQRQ